MRLSEQKWSLRQILIFLVADLFGVGENYELWKLLGDHLGFLAVRWPVRDQKCTLREILIFLEVLQANLVEAIHKLLKFPYSGPEKPKLGF